MTLTRHLRTCASATAALLAGALAAPAEAQDPDDWYHRQPVPSLPEQLNAEIRPHTDARRPERIERIRDVALAIRACWRPPRGALGYSGQELSIRMSFSREGRLIGRPRITYYKRGADPDTRDAFVESVRAALERCVPLPFSATL
ncbi:MAG TPA: hypothetical protein VHN20_11425, partial [Beijerinckiaceae bacterium]|nr:hypothetical protein [Beijerinckiaceae bacterium]